MVREINVAMVSLDLGASGACDDGMVRSFSRSVKFDGHELDNVRQNAWNCVRDGRREQDGEQAGLSPLSPMARSNSAPA